MKKIIVIPPKPPEPKKLKVAAYCRVSTLSPTQRSSIVWQIKSYTKNFMGYTCVDGEIAIVPEQAEVVRKIFDLYLQGLSLGQIKAYLESMGIKTVTGNEHWDTATIQKILKNEKYKGDTMVQKTYTEDFMTGNVYDEGGNIKL